MADFGIMEGIALASLIAGTTQATVSYNQSKHAAEDQKKAQAEALEKQKEYDEKAELQRLEGLKENTEAVDYGNIWGVDVNTKRYADAAQKLSAGTGSFNTDEDETNPFYQRGLL